MKRWMQFGLLLIAMAALSVVTGCQSLFVPQLKVPAGCKAKPGTVAEPYTKTGWAKEIVHEKTGIELVYIPAGTFMMGSPEDEAGRFGYEVQHRVTISKGFYMGKYEVTQAQWEGLMGVTPTDVEFRGANLPVDRVSWDDCQAFCKKGGDGLRLPTEAEWEYACRAGCITKYGGTGLPDEMGWYYENSGTEQLWNQRPKGLGKYKTTSEEGKAPVEAQGSAVADFNAEIPLQYRVPAEKKVPSPTQPPKASRLSLNHPHEVGLKHPNAWGLYDMHGNVWELCSDWYADDPRLTGEAVDPVGPPSGERRVLRGGCWYHPAWFAGSGRRASWGLSPGSGSKGCGFRVVLPAIQ